MKIRWVEATNFRKFVGTVRVDGIGNGISVLVGDNEMGKSTIMEAINGVVFEKAKAQTKETRSFRHFINRTVPEVSIGFDLDGKTWSLKKRFAGPAGKTFLQSLDGQRYEDEEAETELQRLLGFTVSGRNVEPGIWGTLWVRQGHSFGDPVLDERARRTIQCCLEAQVGAVTGGVRGQRLPGAVESALAEIVSSKGPRGRYKMASDQLAVASVKLDELDTKRNQLLADMDRLTSLKRELWNLNQDWSSEEYACRIEAARRKRASAEKRNEEVKAARSDATLATERAARAKAEVKTRVGLITEIEQREGALRDLQDEVESAEAVKDQSSLLLAEREGVLRALSERERQTAEVARSLYRVRNIVLLDAEIDRNEAIVTRAQEEQKAAERLAEQIGRIAATASAIATIDAAEIELSAATAAINAAATIVGLSIEKSAIEDVTVDGKCIDASNLRFEVVEDTVIAVGGVGEILIQPQVKDRQAILKRVDCAKRALKSALEIARVDSPTAVRTAAAERRELEHQLDCIRKEIGRLAPGDAKNRLPPGLDALKIKIEALRGRRDAEMSALGLDLLPERSTIESDIRENTTEAEQLAAEIKAADAGLDGFRQAADGARNEFEALRRKLAAQQQGLETIQAAIAAARNQASDDSLKVQADQMERTAAQLQAAVTTLEQSRGETIKDIDAQISRIENAARLFRDESTRLRTEIARTSGIITASEGHGIDEALDAVRAEQSRLAAQVQNYEQEVAVLELLRDTLRSAEIEAKARYLAPVTTRVEPYLKVLLPGTDLMLDEDFHITGLKRNCVEEEFARLSAGTQEQIAVLTRLGFAELLLDQRRPATVIMDDALVFSDDDRIERMFDVMTRAAERVQIIILTCRKRLFARLGAPMLRIEGSDAHDCR
jgi:energy-coupling factor transporter ATP-binding protein EcfA2